jgi:hypothetical protein
MPARVVEGFAKRVHPTTCSWGCLWDCSPVESLSHEATIPPPSDEYAMAGEFPPVWLN